MKKSLVLLFVAAFCLCLFIAAAPLSAADDSKDKPSIFGNWKISTDFNGRAMVNRAVITAKPSGPPDVDWRGGFGRGKISDVKLENNKLTFVRTTTGRDGEDMETDYEITLQPDGTLKGKMESDFGEFEFTGKRTIPMPDAAGKWEIKKEKGTASVPTQIVISGTEDGKLIGSCVSAGGTNPLSDIKCEKDKLSFTCKSGSTTSSFEGEVKSNLLTGILKSGSDSADITGKRLAQELIGDWDLTSESQNGPRTNRLTVNKDLSAVYSMFGETDVNDLKLDGDKVTFSVKFGFGDREFKQTFAGKLAGDKLDGEFTSDRGTDKAVGVRVGSKPAPPAAPVTPPVAPKLPVETKKPTEPNKK
jgi:hypothetical protein